MYCLSLGPVEMFIYVSAVAFFAHNTLQGSELIFYVLIGETTLLAWLPTWVHVYWFLSLCDMKFSRVFQRSAKIRLMNEINQCIYIHVYWFPSSCDMKFSRVFQRSAKVRSMNENKSVHFN